jgi:hypothetical protein
MGADVALPDDSGIKDHAAKAIVVRQKRGPDLAVQRELLYIPDAVKRGLRSDTSTDEPIILPSVVRSCSHKVDSHDDLDGHRHAVGVASAEELGLREGRVPRFKRKTFARRRSSGATKNTARRMKLKTSSLFATL